MHYCLLISIVAGTVAFEISAAVQVSARIAAPFIHSNQWMKKLQVPSSTMADRMDYEYVDFSCKNICIYFIFYLKMNLCFKVSYGLNILARWYNEQIRSITRINNWLEIH